MATTQSKPYTITIEPGRLLTVEEFAALPPDPAGWRSELIEGRIIRMPPVIDPHHDQIIANLVVVLLPFVRARRLGRVTLELVGYNLTPAGADNGPALVPDLAFVSRERGQLVQDARAHKHYMCLAPDLAVEVFSPRKRLWQRWKNAHKGGSKAARGWSGISGWRSSAWMCGHQASRRTT